MGSPSFSIGCFERTVSPSAGADTRLSLFMTGRGGTCGFRSWKTEGPLKLSIKRHHHPYRGGGAGRYVNFYILAERALKLTNLSSSYRLASSEPIATLPATSKTLPGTTRALALSPLSAFRTQTVNQFIIITLNQQTV